MYRRSQTTPIWHSSTIFPSIPPPTSHGHNDVPTTGGLSFMQALSPRVYLLRLSRDNKTQKCITDDPALIVILGWMNAADGPLAKYACGKARVTAITARATLEQDEEAQKSQQPRSDAAAESRPRLLVHAFSNAPSTMLYHLYTAYETTATSSSSPPNAATVLPLHTTVFDSTPAAFTYQTLVRGILDGTLSSMRFAILAIAYLYVALV
ncbi:hypothetical protein F4678DRAFT_481638 [Xylaria arbuscula]|nr:hypothetical protein F4678DRAFT_481638 [Xylaria arbuscula]